MFYALAVLSMLGYAVQGTLIVRYARTLDGWSVAFYRNASFAMTLLPLLIGSSLADVQSVLAQWPLLALSGFSGAVFLALSFSAYHYLPVGVKKTFSRACVTILLLPVGWIFFNEHLSTAELLLVALIIVSLLWLGVQRNPMAHIRNHALAGIGITVFAVLFLAVTKVVLTVLARQANPLTVAYFWEVSIGVAALGIILLRWVFTRQGLERIEARTVLGIALCSSPTLIATGALAVALSMGPLSIVTAISGGSLAVAALLSHVLYNEKLTRNQWIAIVMVVAAVGGLKFV